MKRISELVQTRDLMISGDYRERFQAEYYQLKIRWERLKNYCDRIERGEDVPHECSIELLRQQQDEMERYKETLERRATIENIEL